MQQDKEGQLSAAQALAASGASTDVVRVGKNFGIGEVMCVVFTLDAVAEAGDADETYKAKLETDDAAAFGSATQIGEEVTIARGSAIGTRKIIVIPPNVNADDWLRAYYTLGGTTPSLTVTARIMPLAMVPQEVTYPAGNTIS